MKTKMWLLPIALGLCASAVNAQTISVGSAAGAAGGATTPPDIGVTFTRNASVPVADFTIRVQYPTTELDATAAGANGGACSVNDASGFVTVLPPPGQMDLATNVYCNIQFTIAPGTADGPLTLTPTDAFGGGGCVEATNGDPVACMFTNGTVTVGPVGPGNVPPTLAYMPAPGQTVVFPGAAGQTLNATIAVTGTGGSGSGLDATARVTNCQTSPPFSPPIFACQPAAPNSLDFTPGGADPGDITCSCIAPVVGTAQALLTCEEISPVSTGTPVTRSWNLTCPGTAGQCGALNFTPPEGVVPFSNGSASIVVNHTGGTVGADTTFGTCSVGGANAGNFSITNSPINFSFPGGSTGQGTISLSCTNSTTTDVTATLSCNQICDGTTPRNWTLSCPGQTVPPPTEEAVPVPTLGDLSRILMAAMLLLIGMGAVTLRSRA